MHVYSAFRHFARHAAVLPPVAPKNAMLLAEDMVLFDFLWVCLIVIGQHDLQFCSFAVFQESMELFNTD